MKKHNSSLFYILIVLLLAASAALRWLALPRLNVDMELFYMEFYGYVAERGFSALGDNFSLAPPLHLYLIWLATLTRGVLSAPTALKLEAMSFDVLSAAAVYKIVRLKYKDGPLPLLAAALFLCLPTVIMNSSLWGQIDSLYTSFLLWCVYFLMKNRPLPSMVMFGLSVSIKLQAIFLLPFLAVLFFKQRIQWYHALIPALVYILTLIPATLAGRPFFELLTLYLSWSGEFPQLAMHAPNLYSFVVGHPAWRQPIYYGGLALTAIVLGGWVVVYARRRFPLDPKRILLTALGSAALTPFLLPRMHDRYFYPADKLSFALAILAPSYWYAAIGYQVISSLVYVLFLFSVTQQQNDLFLLTAILLNTGMVAYLLIRQWQETKLEAGEQAQPSPAVE
jgi:Gpi18-like mannosyltransferase